MKNIAFMEEIGNMDKKIAFMEESDGPINIFWLYGRDEVEFMEENGLNTHIRVFLQWKIPPQHVTGGHLGRIYPEGEDDPTSLGGR